MLVFQGSTHSNIQINKEVNIDNNIQLNSQKNIFSHIKILLQQ